MNMNLTVTVCFPWIITQCIDWQAYFNKARNTSAYNGKSNRVEKSESVNA